MITEITMGFCPHCHEAYGYIRNNSNGCVVNEFSKCVCENTKTAYEKDVYKEHTAAIKSFMRSCRINAA